MCPFSLYYVVLVSVLKPFKRIITHLPELMMHVGHKTLKVTINDQRDVESPLQRSSAVLYHHRVEPRILFTNILNLQSVVEVDLNLFHLKLRAVVYLLALFKPAQTHFRAAAMANAPRFWGQPALTTAFQAWERQTHSLVI